MLHKRLCAEHPNNRTKERWPLTFRLTDGHERRMGSDGRASFSSVFMSVVIASLFIGCFYYSSGAHFGSLFRFYSDPLVFHGPNGTHGSDGAHIYLRLTMENALSSETSEWRVSGYEPATSVRSLPVFHSVFVCLCIMSLLKWGVFLSRCRSSWNSHHWDESEIVHG